MPPLVGVAVNVTLVPAQTGPDGEAEMLTLAGNSGLTVMVMPGLVAGLPVAQIAFDVICTVITSPFANVVDV